MILFEIQSLKDHPTFQYNCTLSFISIASIIVSIMSKKHENNNQHFIQRISLNVEANNQFTIGRIPKKKEQSVDKEKFPLPSILKNMGLCLDSDLEFSSSNDDDLAFDRQSFKTLNLYSNIPKERTSPKMNIAQGTDDHQTYLLGMDVIQTDGLRNEDVHALIAYYKENDHVESWDKNHPDYVEDIEFHQNRLMWYLKQMFREEIIPHSIKLNNTQLAALLHFYQENNDTVSFANQDISLVDDYYQEKEGQEIDHADLHKYLLRKHFERLGEDPIETDSFTIDQIKSLIHFYKSNQKQSERNTFHEQLIIQTKEKKKNTYDTKKEKETKTKKGKENETKKETKIDDMKEKIVVTNMKHFFAIPDEYKPKKFGQICEDTLKFWHHM